jgi:hypothetical protein
MFVDHSLLQLLRSLPDDAARALAVASLSAAAMIVSGRGPSGATAALLTLANPFFLLSILRGAAAIPLLLAGALLLFSGFFSLSARRDDRGTVLFATGAASSVALLGFAPALHAPLALLSPFLSPWRRSGAEIAGFLAAAWTPAVAVVAASAYLAWLAAPTPLDSAANFTPALDASRLIALLAAPSILTGLIAPPAAGGARRGALLAAAALAGFCLLAPPDLPRVTLAATAFAAEAAFIARGPRRTAALLAEAAFGLALAPLIAAVD